MSIRKRFIAHRQAIAKLKHDTPLILASNCMGGRVSATWGVIKKPKTWGSFEQRKYDSTNYFTRGERI